MVMAAGDEDVVEGGAVVLKISKSSLRGVEPPMGGF